MVDVRSKKCVFVSHCILAQGVMADGLVKRYPGSVKPIVQFCLDNDISILQMPCPETLCASGGLGRSPRGKKWYEESGLRETSKIIATGQVEYMERFHDAGFQILAIIGVEFSPACAVNYLNKGPAIYRDQGIFIEELRRAMKEREFDIPLMGISQRWHKKMVVDLQHLLDSASAGEIGGLEENQSDSRTSELTVATR